MKTTYVSKEFNFDQRDCPAMSYSKKVTLSSSMPGQFLDLYFDNGEKQVEGTIGVSHAKQLRDALIEIYPLEDKPTKKVIVDYRLGQWEVTTVTEGPRTVRGYFPKEDDAWAFANTLKKE